MTLSSENKQGGELKRWSLTTALWPRDTGATATCEQLAMPPLECAAVCVSAHALVCVSVIPQLKCDCLVPECVPLYVLVLAFCSNNYGKPHGQYMYFFVLFVFLYYVSISKACSDANVNVPHFTVKEMHKSWGWLNVGKVTQWHTPSVSTVLPGGYSCHSLIWLTLHITAQTVAPGPPQSTYTKLCPRPPSPVLEAQIP